MGNAFQWFRDLDLSVLSRRSDKYKDHRSDPSHPEKVPVVEMKPDTNDGSKSNAVACSPLYIACRENNLARAKRLLKTLTLEDVDRIEPNGSTALHAACYHGHQEVVKLLLELGADRSIQNKYGCLPYDEAAGEEIRQLFIRVPNMNRLVCDTGVIEWERIDEDAFNEANSSRLMIKSLYDSTNVVGSDGIRKMFERIEKNYIDKSLAHAEGIEQIRRYFRKATEQEDPKWIVTAFSAETDFYKFLNRELAGGCATNQMERTYIVALLLYHPKLDALSYIGASCRVMRINEETLEKYKKAPVLMTKAFLSSSLEEKVAVWFAHRANLAQQRGNTVTRFDRRGKVILQWVLCKYIVKHRRSALNIENISQYALEGEVLIMPYTVFKVKSVSQIQPAFIPDDCAIHMIEVEECEPYSA